jgi:NCAIR mutase (PurE)-related protein
VNAESIRKLFEEVRKGKVTPDDAVARLRHMPFEDIGFAKVDHHRALRSGMPEVILGEGKTPGQVAGIFSRLAKHGGNVLATRASEKQFAAVKKKVRGVEFRELGRAIVLKRDETKYGKGVIAVVSAGTSDIPVAEEAVVTAEVMGNEVEHFYDVGVAGIHRLLANREALTKARVVIVCAGMEGALPSVLAGLVDSPLIAVPTSVGAGVSEGGRVALMSMLASCSPGIAVVNIDNGFGAACMAIKMMNQLPGKP